MQDYILMEVDKVKQELVSQGYDVVVKQNSFSDTKDTSLVTNIMFNEKQVTIIASNFKL